MSGSNNSGSNTSKMAVPQAKHRRRDGQKNDHETGRADVRQVKKQLAGSKKQLPASKKQLAARPKTAPHPWCDVKPFFLYNIHFTIFHSHGTQVPDGHALLSHHR